GNESARHDGRRLAPIQGVHSPSHRPVEGAGHRVAFVGAAARQPDAQHGRRAADRGQNQWRRRADQCRGQLHQGRSAGARPRDYAVKLIGIDHVGIASDFDGGGGIDGWNSAAESFNVTQELVRRGYTEEQIAKIWSGNLLRVWSEVERVAKAEIRK